MSFKDDEPAELPFARLWIDGRLGDFWLPVSFALPVTSRPPLILPDDCSRETGFHRYKASFHFVLFPASGDSELKKPNSTSPTAPAQGIESDEMKHRLILEVNMIDREMKSQQQLRQMALDAQMLAIDAQTGALVSMDREHSFGTENSADVERLRSLTRQFLIDARAVVSRSGAVCINETRAAVTALGAQSRQLKVDADRLAKQGRLRAQFRHDNLMNASLVPSFIPPSPPVLPVSGDSVAPAASPDSPPASPDSPVPARTEEVVARADFACLEAELDEFAAFAMQVHALCNLTMEFALNAVAQCSRCNSNI